ncbi:hypothetical protein V498_03750, partial [Pseudogymnoascus sp. VKM F-4517 (FW-2822)]
SNYHIVTITAVIMSDSELSDLPSDHESYSQIEELSLPHLIPQSTPILPSVEVVNGSLSNILQRPRVVLPPTTSKLFTKGLYRRELLDTRPPTIKMINDKWQQKSKVLDVIHLQEPIHSGEYLAQQLALVTDDMGITGAVFTCTRDNASANTVMLAEYEKIAKDQEVTTQQPWTFRVKEGDVRCIAHIINIAVQDALKTLKAAPAEQAESYRCEQGAARIPTSSSESNIEIKNTLSKLRRHIYVFRNRRQWKDALQKQTIAAGLKKLQLSLDMPVRWNSTYEMVSAVIKLQTPITAICATQQMDLSMRDIALTPEDWITLHALQNFFYIFVKPSQKLQASVYPTLNFAIPQYLKMIKKLEALQKEVGISSTIGLACIAASKKLNEYYTLATNHRWSHSGVATICDPRMNLNVFNSLWPSNTEEVKRNRVKQQFHDVFIQYRDRQYFLEEEQRDAEANLPQLPTEPDSDDDLYISHSPATDILKYWAAKQYQYPIIAAIARDHLAIPATSAPSERVFSNGADILTKKRNRLSPETLRYLLCLRDWGHIVDTEESEAEDADDEREE